MMLNMKICVQYIRNGLCTNAVNYITNKSLKIFIAKKKKKL